ncbi:hypothetical protein DPQ33_03550 [Oceanidesulfovibrio indonesiensis]|uniref:Uncharacterized protein n=1 Tax=Oceanidesulfovibrio indonesiensis TaxID=54767 RepID=A0A7M3MID1_9BACT|nr:hypothetical protein [Oceanidesulfovibrio indonesiensis]TVM19446.1 hypothetical protein DPQ33_03550 [Oceanidesulfovibrio indonesiensis]
MDFSSILAQSEVVVLVFLLLCFVGLLLIFYITYRALSNLREELQNQLDIASARLERLERAMNASAAAALSETQGAQSLGELLDDEAPEPAPEPRQETEPRGAPKAVGSEVCAEPVSERAESPRQKHIDTEELALLEAEALSGQLREGIFAASATGAVSARTAWDEEEDAEASTPAAPPIPEEETDWSEIDLSETAIEFDDADLEDEEEPPAGTAAPELESEDADAHELLLDLSEEGDDARLGSTMDFEEEGAFGSLDESLDSDEMEGDEIAAANEWSEPLETEEELAFDGTIDFEDISEDDIAVAGAMQAPDSGQREVQLTLDEPVSESMVDELSLGDALVLDELEEPGPAPESAAEAGELEGEMSLDEALIFEESDEPASAAPSPAPESAAEAGELEGAISLDEDLIFEESDEPASAAPSPAPESAAEGGELEGEISLDEALIFEEADEPTSAAPSLSTAEPVVKGATRAGPFTMSGDEDDDLVFEGLDKGFAPESGESEGAEHKEPSLAGAMLLDEEGGGEAESPELEDRVEAAGGAKPSKRIVSIEDDDYEFDNPSETMILLDEDMGPARRAFVEEEDDAEGEEIGGQALFEELEREGGPAEEFAAASPETLFWTGDDDAPIYFGDEDDAETIAQPFVSQAQDVTAEHPARETAGSLAVDETPVESEEPVQQRHPVLDETVPEPEAEGLDLDVEMALNETFLEEDLLYLEGLMKDTREEAGNTGDAVRKPAASTASTREPAGYSGGAKSADPLGDDDIVFEDIGELDAVDVVEPFEPSAGEGSFADEDSEDFMLEEENIEFGMPISPGSSAAPYLSGDDDIFFEDATEAEAVRPPVSYEAKIEPLHGGDAGTGGSEADDDMVIDFEQDIAALEDMLDQTKKKPNDE